MTGHRKIHKYVIWFLPIFSFAYLICFPFHTHVHAGDGSYLPSWINLGGYAKQMFLYSWSQDDDVVLPEINNWDSISHFRLKIALGPSEHFEGALHIKSQTYWGDSVENPFLVMREEMDENNKKLM